MTLTRRAWLRTAVLGAGALAAGPLLGCHGPVREDLDESLPASGRVPHLDPLVTELLRWASLAPSSRNTQPWTVRLTAPDRAVLGLDPARRLTALDPDDTESLIGLGAFVENFAIAAGVRGLRVDARARDTLANPGEVVDLEWHVAPPKEDELDRLTERRTLRAGYSSQPLRPADLRALVEPLEGHVHVVDPRSSDGRWVRDGAVEATRLQSERRQTQMEVASWLRWRDDDARRHRDGLTPECMEIEGLSNWWARSTYSRTTALTPGYARRTVETVRRRASQCGAWLVVTGEDDSVASRVETGRRFERMALLLRGLGLAAHPMTQVLEEPALRADLVRSLRLSEPPRLLLRVGYVAQQDVPVSLRRPVSWFVTA